MVSFKNIIIKKRGGGTRKQRVKVLSSGKYKFVKNKGKSRNPRPKKKARKVKRKMARRNRRRSKRGFTIPLAPTLGLAAGLAKPIQLAMQGRYESAINTASANFTGYYPPTGFNIEHMKNGLLPLAIGLLIHKFVGGPPLNANRVLAAAGVPFIRI